jgi:mRNA-degrading endonuclease toxin of MazEF toxin-antitoxin module
LTPAAGEIWLADRGEEQRRLVFVVSDERFHRLSGRAVIAPVLDAIPSTAYPWHVALSEARAVGVNQIGTAPVERLLERTETTAGDTLRRVRHAVHAIVG